MRFISKICLFVVFLLPAMVIGTVPEAHAQELAIVSINDGIPIELEVGGSIPGSDNSGIALAVRNLPAFEEGNGFAVFEIRIVWDSSLIRVDSVTQSRDMHSNGWTFTHNTFENNNQLIVNGYTVTSSGFQDDVVICFLGVTAIGEPGDTSPLSIIWMEIQDTSGITMIPASPVGATVRISAEEYLSIQPTDGMVIAGENLQFTAEIVKSETDREDVTDKVTWTTGADVIATIESAGGENPGMVTGVREGATMIRAEYQGLSCTTTVTVSAAEEETIEPEPETVVEEIVEQEQVEPEPEDTPEPELIDETPVDDPEPELPATTEQPVTTEQPDTTDTVEAELPDTDDDDGSGLPLGWIIGGAAVFVAVIGALGYTLFIRGR